MSKSARSAAPIVFLIGPSTTGKTTIYKEIAKQDQDLPEEERLNWQLYGFDQAFTEEMSYLRGLLADNDKFETVKHSLSPFLGRNEQDIFYSMASGALIVPFHPKKPYLSLLDDEEFRNGIDEFMEI